jgi:hypothetical protein
VHPEVLRPAQHVEHALDGDALADPQQHAGVGALHADVDAGATAALHVGEHVAIEMRGMRGARPPDTGSRERVA